MGHIPQEEHRITRLQGQGVLMLNMQPARPMQDHMKACPLMPVQAAFPLIAVLAQVKQAGRDLQPGQEQFLHRVSCVFGIDSAMAVRKGRVAHAENMLISFRGYF